MISAPVSGRMSDYKPAFLDAFYDERNRALAAGRPAGVEVKYRVPSRSGRFLGVRVSHGDKGWWIGAPFDEYEAMESRLASRALDRVIAEVGVDPG